MNEENQAKLSAIGTLDEQIRVKSDEILAMRHEFLRNNGWVIYKEKVGPTYCYLYQKFGEMFICEHEAIDREVNGV